MPVPIFPHFSEKQAVVTHRIDMRERFLRTLVEYAHESGTFNPHFQRKEMMKSLGLSEADFKKAQKELGDKYCRYVGPHDGDARYDIYVSKCLVLRDQLDEKKIQERRHKQLVWLAVLCAILAAVTAVALDLSK